MFYQGQIRPGHTISTVFFTVGGAYLALRALLDLKWKWKILSVPTILLYAVAIRELGWQSQHEVRMYWNL